MLRLEESVRAFDVDGETVLLDEKARRYYGLNQTASRMLAVALASRDEESALSALCLEYEAPEEKLKSDLSALIAGLKEKHLASHGTVSA